MKKIQVKCKKCGDIFIPDLNTRGYYWNCQKCNAKIPNLRRHYRFIADVCIIGLISSILGVGLSWYQQSEQLVCIITLGILKIMLLLITIISIYSAKMPWQSSKINALIWTIFGVSVFFDLLAPYLIIVMGAENIPFLNFFLYFFLYFSVLDVLIFLFIKMFSFIFIEGGTIVLILFYIFIFSYLFWLRSATKKCSLTEEIAGLKIRN